VAPEARPIATIDGLLFRRLCSDACALLHRHIAALNAINVFPVPDGDTGTNMHLTLRAGIDELASTDGTAVSDAARALAHGALMGARGNSGVIFSQVLRGLDSALAGREQADGAALTAGFSMAVDAAREAISQPKEGTILTVIRDVAEALDRERPESAEQALSTATTAAYASVERTPELLPVLKEAGVVDAGGLGLAIILEGLLRSLRGQPLDVDLAPEGVVNQAWRAEGALHQSTHGERGYCTEFIVSHPSAAANDARERLGALGTSLLVVGSDNLLRVHLHTEDPDSAIAYGRSLGDVSHVKVDNLEAQIERFVADATPPPVASTIDVVAVAAGAGIEAAFRSVGVTHLVRGGQTMNPSAGEILAAIESCPAAEVVVLPNNNNIIAAAEQAAKESTKRVAVVPSRSLPQGVAAVLALNRDLSFEANTETMQRALASVRSAEVTRAVRATTLDGRAVAVGQAIGIVEGTLRVVADDLPAAARRCVDEMLWDEASLLTVYSGEDVRDADAEALVESLRGQYASLEVELVRGGQPHYPYILSLE
jgi:DAK2 domain fusion protein YloV